jgi:hypothetical protein
MSPPEITLTEDEQTLHHRAATLKKMLEAYHACESKDEEAWRDQFKDILVYLHLHDHSWK